MYPNSAGSPSVADPREAPWKEHGVELVLECSGAHRTLPSLEGHFAAGAHYVIESVTELPQVIEDIEGQLG